jgi:hypothetical protein
MINFSLYQPRPRGAILTTQNLLFGLLTRMNRMNAYEGRFLAQKQTVAVKNDPENENLKRKGIHRHGLCISPCRTIISKLLRRIDRVLGYLTGLTGCGSGCTSSALLSGTRGIGIQLCTTRLAPEAPHTRIPLSGRRTYPDTLSELYIDRV